MFRGLGQDYYGPPAPGQTYAEYQTQMGVRVAATVGAAVVGMALVNPVVGIVAGVGTWLATPTLVKKVKGKPKVQGG